MNRTRHPVCTSSLVIFGATGDLTRRKLIPALARLCAAGLLPSDLHVIAVGRRDITPERLTGIFRDEIERRNPCDTDMKNGFESLASHLHYLQIDPGHAGAAETFAEALKTIEGQGAAPARLFYLAVPPDSVVDFLKLVTGHLDRDRVDPCPARVLVEKPFGHDLPSARILNERLLNVAREDQIYRIDHYLGKEAVQNILVMRFGNVLFDPVWNRSTIDHVQISVAEEIGVGGRGSYYDRTGVVRDVVQNHLLQVLALIAMESPISGCIDTIRDEKVKVLRSLRPLSGGDVAKFTARARYSRAKDRPDGGDIRGYLEEDGVSRNSTTETYAAFKVGIDSWRWVGVPFYLRAGKCLSTSITEVALFFKAVPLNIFPATAGVPEPNALIIRVQPDEGIKLRLQTKIPGMTLKLGTVDMDFSYRKSFGSARPDAYERLLLDALNGDPALFLRNDEIETAWSFIDPILAAWHDPGKPDMGEYVRGSEGPDSANDLIAADGRACRILGSMK
ncbi:MAG: glucose-6-phosphate dehydrogenase [Candidatus Riflebacteria bacterium]|nr:glucose-6-phosphate dehydrogenase [Candidatus Riflebacteria bacterium]